MFEYLKEISARLDLAAAAEQKGGGQRIEPPPPAEPISLFRGFAEEVARLDARDFEPSARAPFVEQKAYIKYLAEIKIGLIPSTCALHARKILPFLDAYQGAGSGAIIRDFSFIQDADVRKIIERDYKELKLRAFPDGAWKSTVILCGGILEAILYDKLVQNPTAAMAASRAPRKKGGVKDITKHDWENQWSLSDMIKVAVDLNIISKSNEDSVDEVLREYRNFVHPRVEVEKKVSITEGHAMASFGSLEVIMDKLK